MIGIFFLSLETMLLELFFLHSTIIIGALCTFFRQSRFDFFLRKFLRRYFKKAGEMNFRFAAFLKFFLENKKAEFLKRNSAFDKCGWGDLNPHEVALGRF